MAIIGLVASVEASRTSLPVIRQAIGKPRPSTVNCTWRFFNQTLDHFTPGVTEHHGTATYNQRYCIYSEYWKEGAPIFFYVGNESPVEEYVNSTGLMWELAPQMVSRSYQRRS
jgi:lysosomal Pro-X carboxypeptidase